MGHIKHHEEFSSHDQNVKQVVLDVCQEVHFLIVHFSGVHLVKEVHVHKEGKQEGEVLGFVFDVTLFGPQVVALAEHKGAEEQEDQQDELLVSNLAKDVFPHRHSYDFVLLGDSLGILGQLLHSLWWGLSGEGEGCKDVHHNIDPKELDDSERSFSND